MKENKHIDIIDPTTGEVIDFVPITSKEEVESIGYIVKQAALQCRSLSRFKRSDILAETAKLIALEKHLFATLITQETGKTITQSYKEVDRCINTFQLAAEEVKRHIGEQIPFDSYHGAENRQGYFTREPLGVIVAITPFNDPLNLVAHKLAPAIAAGNSILLKPSELAPLSAIKLKQLIVRAGFPENAIAIVTGDAITGRALVSLPYVRMVSFTGGITTGEAIVKAGGLKKYAMDLGGNAPVIVLADCDLDQAVEACVLGSFWAAGQNCIGTQRIIIEDEIYDTFKQKLLDNVKLMKVGDPMDPEVDMGPMISEQAAKAAQEKVNLAVQTGAKVLCGHTREGAFYQPTVLENVSRDAQVLSDEVFGPIVSLIKVNHFEQALTLANEPDYSLHAGIFTNDLAKAQKAIKALEFSGVMINDSSDYRFDAMPFGGYKYGGLGREGVKFAMQEMSQTKTVCFVN